MSRIIDGTLRFFVEAGWFHNHYPDQGYVHLVFKGDNGEWQCFAYPREEAAQLAFYSVAPVRCPPGRMAAVMEFLTRANYGMVLGCFEMDLSDGEIRYKTSLDVEGVALDPALVRNIVHPNCSMMDQYLPGLMSVIYAGTSPEAAIQKVEGGADEADEA